jgi:tetratricopeptide (TPR) repeat protein
VPTPAVAPAKAPAADALPVPKPAAAAAPAQPPVATEDPVAAAIAARKAGRFDEAEALLRTHLQGHPQDAQALHELGVLYAIHGQIPNAVARFQTALALRPQQTETRRALAETLRSADRCAEARDAYLTLVDADDQDAVAWRGLVLCDEGAAEFERAIQTCQDIERRFPGTPLAAWATTRKPQLLAAKAGSSLDVAAADAEGKALFGEHRYPEAEVWFALALHQTPSADRAYRLAMARLGTHDLFGSLGALQQALALDANHLPTLSAWPAVAKAARIGGTGGLDVSLTAMQRTPFQHVAAAILDDDLVLARQLLIATKAAGNRGVVLTTLSAEVALREGQTAKAATAFLEALTASKDFAPARKGLADAYTTQGRFTEARELAGLPRPGPGTETSVEDLKRFQLLRRAELDHQLRMAMDPNLRALPALADQVLATAPPPPPPPPVSLVEPAAPVKAAPAKAAKSKTSTSKGKKAKKTKP